MTDQNPQQPPANAGEPIRAEALPIGSLFSGIGGLELGLEWAGLGPTVWQVEQDPYCLQVLERHWPEARRYDDVCTVGKHNLAPVDLICGGFPCQDVSAAGKGAGLSGDRSGLWFHMARIIREMQPTVVVVENVASGATRWVDEVRRELAGAGYDSLPVPLSAADCGAWHLRRRVFIVAIRNAAGPRHGAGRSGEGGAVRDEARRAESERRGGGDGAGPAADPSSRRHRTPQEEVCAGRDTVEHGGESAADADDQGQLQQGGAIGAERGRAAHGGAEDATPDPDMRRVRKPVAGATGSALPSVPADSDGVGDVSADADSRQCNGWKHDEGRGAEQRAAASGGSWWAAEPPLGRVALRVPHRVDRLRALGNCVVPQCSQVVGEVVKMLLAHQGGQP